MHKVIKYAIMQETPVVISYEPEMPPQEEIEEEIEEQADDAVEENEIDIEKLREELLQEVLAIANQKADTITANAQSEAVRQLAAANEQAATIKQQAFDEGSKEGYASGFAQGEQAAKAQMQQSVADAAQKAENILVAAQEESKSMILAAERQIVDIAITLARKVLSYEVEENPMVILSVVKGALEKVRDQEQIVIRVNPADMDMVIQARRELQLITGIDQELTMKADETISLGGCIIDTAYGSVDARLDPQFDMLVKALQGVMP